MPKAASPHIDKWDRSWRREGWIPVIAVFGAAVLITALIGGAGATEELSSASGDVYQAWTTPFRTFAEGAIGALSLTGVFFSYGIDWILQSLIALIVAIVAVPALKELSGRAPESATSEITQIAERVSMGVPDADSSQWLDLVPGIQAELLLRRFAGISGQLIAALTAFIWTTFGVATLVDPRALPAESQGTLIIAPLILALAVLAGMYRIAPERTRTHLLLVQVLTEQRRRHRAARYTPPANPGRARQASRSAWGVRICVTLVLASLVLMGIGINLVSRDTGWENLFDPWWDLPLALLLALMLFGLVIVIFSGAASGAVWARYWVGGAAGWALIATAGVLWAVFAISLVAGVVIPALLAGDWGLSVLLCVAMISATIGEGLPLVLTWRKSVALLPGYNQMTQISDAMEAYISRSRSELAARVSHEKSRDRHRFLLL